MTTTMTFAEALSTHREAKHSVPIRSLCANSDISEKLAFQFLGYKQMHQVVSEVVLSNLYPKSKVPDAIFSTIHGNAAVEVKRVKNVMHKDTVVNAIEKLGLNIVKDFNIKTFHMVFQTRENAHRNKVKFVLNDVHGILKKMLDSFPYKKHGVKIYVHVQKVGEVPFKNIGYN